MNTAATRPRRSMVFAFGLLLIPAVVIGEPVKDKQPKPDAKRAAELVDAIVNRNKPPKFVDWPRSQYKGTRKAALFPEDYDWKEEERVKKAIKQLEKDQTEEVWEEMVKRIGDRRYSDIGTDAMTGDALMGDVGNTCNYLAHWRLIGVFRQHMPYVEGKVGSIRLPLEVGIDDLSKWRKQRAAKSLYELQIEVCERAIEDLAKAEGVPQAQKDESRKKLEAQIAELKKSKRPVHVPDDRPLFSESGRYNADVAKRVREGVKSGNYEDLGILLGIYK